MKTRKFARIAAAVLIALLVFSMLASMILPFIG